MYKRMSVLLQCLNAIAAQYENLLHAWPMTARYDFYIFLLSFNCLGLITLYGHYRKCHAELYMQNYGYWMRTGEVS